MPDLLRQQPKESDGMDSVIVVDGIPGVSAERLDKLKGVVRKIYGKVCMLKSKKSPHSGVLARALKKVSPHYGRGRTRNFCDT